MKKKIKETLRKIATGTVLISMIPFVLCLSFLIKNNDPIKTTKADFLEAWDDYVTGEVNE